MTRVVSSTSLWELVEDRAARTPEALMFETEEGDRGLTFEGFSEAARHLADALDGVDPGTPVAWQLPANLSACVLAAALSRRGAIQIPLLPSYRERELSFVVHQVGIGTLFMPPTWRGFDYRALGQNLQAAHPGLQVLHVDDVLAMPDATATLPKVRPRRDAKGAPRLGAAQWIFYTSGTTGVPKGVKHTDAALVAAAEGMAGALGLSSKDRHALVFPLTHVGGIVWIMVGLMAGMPQLLVEVFRPETTIASMRRFGVTVAGASTAFHQAYLAAQRAQPDRPVFPQVRMFPGGAAPKPPGLHYELKAELGGAGIVAAYGLTECPILAMNSPSDPDEKLAGTEGVALPGVSVRVVGADDRVLRPGEVGELRVRGRQLFSGYVDPSLDAGAYDQWGWLRTGDLGSVDDQGHITITGRLKDVIIRKGETISAKEIEDLLYLHPQVGEAAVVGLADPERGERVCAVVRPQDPADPPTLGQLAQFLSSQGLMAQKLPEQLELREELPRNASGKVQKDRLRSELDTVSVRQ